MNKIYLTCTDNYFVFQVPGFKYETESKQGNDFGWCSVELFIPLVGFITYTYMPGDGFSWFLEDKGQIRQYLIIMETARDYDLEDIA